MKCPNDVCDTQIEESWQYCPKCGYNLAAFFKDVDKMLDLAKREFDKENFRTAIFCWTKCSKLGNAQAMYNLGLCYQRGLGVPINIKTAFYCFSRAAEVKEPPHFDAHIWLGDRYYSGKEPVEKDLVSAYKYYEIAYAGGHSHLRGTLEKIRSDVDTSLAQSLMADGYDSEDEDESSFDLEAIKGDGKFEKFTCKITRKTFTPQAKRSGLSSFEDEKKNYENVERKIDDEITYLRNNLRQVGPINYSDEDEWYDGMNNKKHNERISANMDNLIAVSASPYFGRIRIKDGNGDLVDYCIGTECVMTTIDGRIVWDWRSEWGNFFRNRSSAVFESNGERLFLQMRREVTIRQKKFIDTKQTFSIDDGENKLIYDEFLKSILTRKKEDPRLTDIISSIQDNQNQIITRPLRENLIVQGCAGSGKTMILLHRLSYLKYNHKIDDATLRIITPSETFNAHIDSLRHDLDIAAINAVTLSGYYLEKLSTYDKRWKEKIAGKYNKNHDKWETPPCKISEDSELPEDIVDYYYSQDFFDKIESEFNYTYEKYKNACDKKRTDYYEVRLPAYDKALEKYHSLPLSLRAANPQSRPKLSLPTVSIRNGIFAELKPDYNVSPNKIYKCELYASLLLSYKVFEAQAANTFLFIDEGQDISIAEYKLLKNMNKAAVFNIFGDIKQSLHKHGLDTWDKLQEVNDFYQYELNENYRNTKEITEFVNKLLEKEMTVLGIDGNKVMYYTFTDNFQKNDWFFRESHSERIAFIYSQRNKDDGTISGLFHFSKSADFQLLTVEQAKGLEFDKVYVYEKNMTENEKYIAMTRALKSLIILRTPIYKP
ncbi:MAG: AAA family ATPase [Clostridiaceae bacterium]|jgi:DNA helicase IV|nr:AAA family ATPase [Clostridiaceae bacterium]